jgi:hypothetical protein
MTSSAEHQPYVNIPHTIFAEAQAFLRTLKDPGAPLRYRGRFLG